MYNVHRRMRTAEARVRSQEHYIAVVSKTSAFTKRMYSFARVSVQAYGQHVQVCFSYEHTCEPEWIGPSVDAIIRRTSRHHLLMRVK